MRTKFWILFAFLMMSLSLTAIVCAQTGIVYFKEDFSYLGLDQMQAAGWTFTRPAGFSVGAGAVTLDGTGGDCSMHRATTFSNNVYDWKAEVRSKWLGQGHSVLSVFVGTERHSYGFAADGYYREFSFYRDSQKVLHFGIYGEQANQYATLSMIREGNTFSFYFNGELKNTYTETDTQQSAVTGMDLVSPWRGDAKYDYYQLGEPNAVFTLSNPTATPSGSTDSFPLVPVIIGGGITAAVIGGIAVYYFFIAGGSGTSAGSSGAGSTGAGNTSSGSEGESGLEPHTQSHPQPIEPYGTVVSGTFLDRPDTPPPSETQPIEPYGTVVSGTGFGDSRSVTFKKAQTSSKKTQPDNTSNDSK